MTKKLYNLIVLCSFSLVLALGGCTANMSDKGEDHGSDGQSRAATDTAHGSPRGAAAATHEESPATPAATPGHEKPASEPAAEKPGEAKPAEAAAMKTYTKEEKQAMMKEWDEKVKAMSVEDMEKVTAVIETNQGTIKIEFFPDKAPGHVRNFIKLAQSHFYDGLIFHRVIKGFMIQGGCPDGTGTGGPGYNIDAEFNDVKHVEGVLSMARSSNPNSAGSQFFICLGSHPHLDHNYTAFGKVIEGMDVVRKIGTTPTGRGDRPVEEQVMEKVYIEGL